MTNRIAARISTNPYDDVTIEIESWLERPGRWFFPARWAVRLQLRPRDQSASWIPMTIGNEYTGLIYGLTRDRAVGKAQRIGRKYQQEHERRRATTSMVSE